ncbi:MAG: histidine kinase dimerization/phospho-acceptor domain-containing protein, partial [Sphingomonas sp.]
MRFDDTLETVLAGDFSTPSGMQSAWRQLVDLIGRRRVYADPRAVGLLRRIRPQIPAKVRAASARGLEYANPPAPLVRLFGTDEIAVALPVLRSARLTSNDWIEILPELAPAGRAVLRNRRDLSPVVRRALESYGPIDFVLPDQSIPAVEEIALAPEPLPELEPIAVEEPVAVAPEPAAVFEPVVAPEPEPIVEPVAELLVASEVLIDWTEVIGPQEREPVAVAPAAPVAALPVETAESEPVALAPDVPESAPVEAAPEAPEPEIAEPIAAPETIAIEEDFSFVELAGGAVSLPNPTIFAPVATPPIQSGTVEAEAPAEPIAEAAEAAHDSVMAQQDTAVAQTSEETSKPIDTLPPVEPLADSLGPQHEPEVVARETEADGPFAISEVVARIDAFWKNREEGGDASPRLAPVPADHFRFETDAKGVVRWVDGVSRAPIVGLSLDLQGPATGMADGSRVDGVAAGAFRRRAGFSNARMAIDGESDASGDWLISAIPVFDPANGRFTGYRGTARRPRADERAEPVRAPAANPTADSLRQLVHELRTPTNAIAGFAEMIETQMLGPVSDPYRDRANTIRAQARELLGAIDDLDLAARIDSAALALVPGRVTLRPVLSSIADDLAQLSALRGSALSLPIDDLAVTGDRRAVERLLARLMATLVSASGPGERIGIRTALESD